MSDGAGDKSSEMKTTDNPEKILMSDGAGCDVVTQSQAKIPDPAEVGSGYETRHAVGRVDRHGQ
jgi:hypothetical protein